MLTTSKIEPEKFTGTQIFVPTTVVLSLFDVNFISFGYQTSYHLMTLGRICEEIVYSSFIAGCFISFGYGKGVIICFDLQPLCIVHTSEFLLCRNCL